MQPRNGALKNALISIFGDTGFDRGTPANNFLFGEWKNGIRSPGAFDIISNNFAAGAKGDVIAIIPKANPGQVFGATELKALLENGNVTRINGLPRNALLELVKDVSNITPDELTNVFNFGSNGSNDQVMLTGYFAGGANRYHLQFDDATYQATELRGVRICLPPRKEPFRSVDAVRHAGLATTPFIGCGEFLILPRPLKNRRPHGCRFFSA